MGLVAAVVQLTERLIPYVKDEHQRLLQLLATMPWWTAKQDLSEWEAQCGDAIGEAEVKADCDFDSKKLKDQEPFLFLIGEVYELGCHNMYTSYQVDSTKQEYQRLLALFREFNIPGEKPLAEVNLSTW